MTIRTSNLGAGNGFQLAPDLDFISTSVSSNNTYTQVTLDPSGALTTALSLTGKFAITSLGFSNTLAESFTVKLTIDGAVIINDTFTAVAAGISILNSYDGLPIGTTGTNDIGAIICSDSLLLEIQSTTDTSVNLNYRARPIV